MDANFDKEELRSYLLRTLDDDRTTQLEQTILSTPEAHEELLIAEEELIDQYVAGGLSELERQQFETEFLVTADRQKNLRFGQMLKRYVSSHAAPVAQEEAVPAATHVAETAPAPFLFSPSPRSGRPALAFSIAGVALLGIVLLSWLTFRRPPTRALRQGTDQVVVVTLEPGSITAGGETTKRVNVPPNGYNLKLELELKNAKFRKYKFELFRENKPVQTSGALSVEAKGQQYVVPLTITGEVLSPGDYQVKLSGVLESGADEFIENYSFRVTK